MGTRYRFSLEIADIRERIDNLRGTEIYWREMSLAAKVRTLVLERVEEVENQNKAAAELVDSGDAVDSTEPTPDAPPPSD